MPAKTLRHALPAEEGSIIYLGDIRRRHERQAPDTHYLLALALGAALAWGSWLVIVFYLPPARLLTYLAFFIPLGVALAATGALVAYVLERGGGPLPHLADVCRHGILCAVVVVANLAVLAGHKWNPIVGVVTLALALIVDFVIHRRSA